jgi:hypothetical protein
MEITDYRKIQSRILFTLTGEIPVTPLCLNPEEQDALLDRLTRSWELIDACPTAREPSAIRDVQTSTEKWMGMKRWFLSHHLFITLLALTSFCLREATRACEDTKEAARWAALASRLRRGCAALFLYGIDFQPCVALYCIGIRQDMPPAFSGYWIRERQKAFQPALLRFQRTFDFIAQDKFEKTPRNNWEAADARYHELHERSMYRAVPDGKSLSAIYRQENKKPQRISDEQFEIYDTWFCIDRQPDVTRLDYVFQTCDLIERIIADLMTGHRLEGDILRELLIGCRAAIMIFGDWAGPVPPGSRFYPKYLNGE